MGTYTLKFYIYIYIYNTHTHTIYLYENRSYYVLSKITTNRPIFAIYSIVIHNVYENNAFSQKKITQEKDCGQAKTTLDLKLH